MYLYVRRPPEPDCGIFMQVSQVVRHSGAEEWTVLYARKLDDLPAGESGSSQADEVAGDVRIVGVESDVVEEQLLRHYLRRHSGLVEQEKLFTTHFLTGVPERQE